MNVNCVAVIRHDLQGKGEGMPVGDLHYAGAEALPCRWTMAVTKKEQEQYDRQDTYGWFQVFYRGKWRCGVEIDWDTYRIKGV
jgi:hypothetical protein